MDEMWLCPLGCGTSVKSLMTREQSDAIEKKAFFDQMWADFADIFHISGMSPEVGTHPPILQMK